MFETEPQYIIDTTEGEADYNKLTTTMVRPTEDVNGVVEADLCINCDWPGGGRFDLKIPQMADIPIESFGNTLRGMFGIKLKTERGELPPEPPKEITDDDYININKFAKTPQSSPCTQTTTEKARCPKHYGFFKDLMCTSGRCDSLNCPRCKRKKRMGKLRAGDILQVVVQNAYDAQGPQGERVQILVAQRRMGRYLGLDDGGLLRFETMLKKKGLDQKSGARFWVAPSNCVIEDLDANAKAALSPIDLPANKAQS